MLIFKILNFKFTVVLLFVLFFSGAGRVIRGDEMDGVKNEEKIKIENFNHSDSFLKFSWHETKIIFGITTKGLVNEVTDYQSLAMLASAGGVVYLLSLDENNQQQIVEDANILGSNGHKFADNMGNLLNAQILQGGLYLWAYRSGNNKLLDFCREVVAAEFITIAQTIAISAIPFHERPVYRRGEEEESEDSTFNKILHGASSFPSGHAISSSVLMFKSWEHFGWKAGVPATALNLYICWARVEEGKHYLTDVFGTIALAGVASYATSGIISEIIGNLEKDKGIVISILPHFEENGLGASLLFKF